MKKTLVALSGIVMVAFLVIFVANAQTKDQDVKKKACTEVSKECGKCPSATAATAQAGEAPCAKKCDPAKCKEMGCDPAECKEGCDPAKCKASCKEATAEVKSCSQAKCKMLTEK